MSGMDIQVLVFGLYRSPEFIRAEPLKPPLEGFIKKTTENYLSIY